MKNQFVADRNDFFKYGLLRAMSTQFEKPIGVWWMLTKDDAGSHGNHLGYLNNPKEFRTEKNANLFDVLKKIRDGFIPLNPDARDKEKIYDIKTRNVSLIKNADIVERALYWPHDDCSIDPDKLAGKSHENLRDPFNRIMDFCKMREYFAECPVVFADPDNGIEVKTASKERHIRWHEIISLFEDGHSIIVYQHVQQTDILDKAAEKTAQLKCLLGSEAQYRALSSVVFLIIPAIEHVNKIKSALDDFDDRFAPWLRHKSA